MLIDDGKNTIDRGDIVVVKRQIHHGMREKNCEWHEALKTSRSESHSH